MDYGWFMAPFLIGAELSVAQQASVYINSHPPHDDQQRKDIEDRIYRALTEPAFSIPYRARATWYGNQLNHFQNFNHLYESAVFSYYKREYIQCILTLLTAMEGIMLSINGYSINAGNTKPRIPTLIATIKNSQSPANSPSMVDAHNMYRDTLVKFLEGWIYKNTSQADLSLSVLNRHYVLHGMEPGNFYRPHDAHRLILAFDLIIEFLKFQQGVHHVFLPDYGKDKFIDARREYYEKLAEGNITHRESWTTERALLSQHRRYVAPDHDPTYEESIAKAEAVVAMLQAIANRRKPSA